MCTCVCQPIWCNATIHNLPTKFSVSSLDGDDSIFHQLLKILSKWLQKLKDFEVESKISLAGSPCVGRKVGGESLESSSLASSWRSSSCWDSQRDLIIPLWVLLTGSPLHQACHRLELLQCYLIPPILVINSPENLTFSLVFFLFNYECFWD